uniref:Putative ovule protein n=1 Tax=Solanum chacoense TaxID=4108 RepID=A0A0V0GL14_SOLCH
MIGILLYNLYSIEDTLPHSLLMKGRREVIPQELFYPYSSKYVQSLTQDARNRCTISKYFSKYMKLVQGIGRANYLITLAH